MVKTKRSYCFGREALLVIYAKAILLIFLVISTVSVD